MRRSSRSDPPAGGNVSRARGILHPRHPVAARDTALEWAPHRGFLLDAIAAIDHDAETRNGRPPRVLSWALYDWANSAFAITVMSAFFPLFLKQYWSDGADATLTTFRLGLANSFGSIVIAFLSPVLGAIADQGGTRKRYLILFAAMAIAMTGALQFAQRGDWPLAITLYVLAVIGFSGAIPSTTRCS